jgi:hypothetical protein
MPTDPRGLRGDAPLFDAWLRFYEDAPTPFTIPGHKHRHDLVGDVVAGDVPLYAGLDSMRLERGLLAAAEARAAALWGADVCRFSVGGSTHANQALALAVGGEGLWGGAILGLTAAVAVLRSPLNRIRLVQLDREIKRFASGGTTNRSL